MTIGTNIDLCSQRPMSFNPLDRITTPKYNPTGHKRLTAGKDVFNKTTGPNRTTKTVVNGRVAIFVSA
jgi:hypothetical protein